MANGWALNSDQWLVASDQNNTDYNQLTTNHQPLVTIIFWPQYLEFLGFILLAIAFFTILKIKDKHETTIPPINPQS